MAILESIDYRKFGRFSNVADEIYAKLLWSFHECKLLVVVPNRYDFRFSIIKAAEGKRRTENSTHIHEIETIVNRKVQKSFQSYLEISNNKNQPGEILFPKIERHITKHFNFLPNHLFLITQILTAQQIVL